jgi:uncharacterized membrane protein
MNAKILFALLLAISTSIYSCVRLENNQTAGKGGNAVLRIVPEHHTISTNIINGKIYIKYNALDAPSSFDDSTNCILSNGVPTGIFNNLKKGDYYIVGTGYDTSINEFVKGGLPYTIKEENTFNISLPVTESH